MKPTPLSEYLATPTENRAPGWVVVMRGAGAPSVVHASRGAAEAEASRLIDGLPGNVDQTALVLPIASVLTRKKDVRQPIVGEAFPTEERPKIVGKEFPSTPAPLSIKPHGIYERRDGKIVGVLLFESWGGVQTTMSPVWAHNGKVYRSGSPEVEQDLVREIVVGEGWKPWNGGAMAAGAYEEVDVVFRNGTIMNALVFECLQWGHSGGSSDIVAYREAMPF